MATRLYFVANTAADITPAFDAGWTKTTDALVRTMSTAKAAATETISDSTVTSGAGNNTLLFQLISPPLEAQSILTSGTIAMETRGNESAANDNINQRFRCVYVVSSDGGTVRGTLKAFGSGGGTTELSTTLSGQNAMVNSDVDATVDAEAGDRIVVEWGFGMNGTGTSPAVDGSIGGDGTDHASGTNNDTTGSVPWIEFSQDLTFQVDPTPVYEQGEGFLDYGSNTTSAVVPMPTSVAEDETVLVRIVREFATASAPSTHPALTDWTEVDYAGPADQGDGNSVDMTVLQRVMPASPPSDATFTWTGSSLSTASSHRITGADTTNPIDTSDSEVSGSASTNAPAVQLTTANDDELLVWFAGAYTGADITGMPSGFTNQFQETNLGTGTKAQAAAGDTGALTGSSGNSDVKVAILVALKPPGGDQTANAGQTTETETSQAVTAPKDVAVAQTTETETSQAVTPVTVLALGQVTETETSQAATTPKLVQEFANSQVTEPETAQAATTPKTVGVAQTVETETAQTITVDQDSSQTINLGQVTETETSQAHTLLLEVAVGLTSETETAQAFTVDQAGPTIVPLGQVVETETSQATTTPKTIVVGGQDYLDEYHDEYALYGDSPATELEAALTPTISRPLDLGQPAETETGQAVTLPWGVALGQPSETETAQVVSVGTDQTIALGLVTETETAQPNTTPKAQAIGQVVESETAQTFAQGGTAYPEIGLWRNRPTDSLTWRQEMDANEDIFGPFEGRWSYYYGPGSTPINGVNATALDDGKLLHIYWKPYPAGQDWAYTAAGSHDAVIDAVAAEIASYDPITFHLTLHHEPENDVGPAGFSATDYKNMWQQVRDRFDLAGVTNVEWVMVYMNPDAHPTLMDDLWPGDALVDRVGLQSYTACSTPGANIAQKWLDNLQWMWDNAGAGRNWRPLKADGTGDLPYGFTEYGMDLGGNTAPCGVGGGDRGTAANRAAGFDAIRDILPDLAAWGVYTLDFFDAGSNYLEEKPSVDAEAFQLLKDASEAGSGGGIINVEANQATETEAAQSVTLDLAHPLLQALETETAQSLTVVLGGAQNISLGQVVELETALALSGPQTVVLIQVTESEQAHALVAAGPAPPPSPAVRRTQFVGARPRRTRILNSKFQI